MAEHRGDRFEAHPTVDGLGRERVAQLVGVNVSEAGVVGDATHDPADVMTVECVGRGGAGGIRRRVDASAVQSARSRAALGCSGT